MTPCPPPTPTSTSASLSCLPSWHSSTGRCSACTASAAGPMPGSPAPVASIATRWSGGYSIPARRGSRRCWRSRDGYSRKMGSCHNKEEENMQLIRVFPRRTKATPDDPLVYIGEPDLFAQADAVHVSVTFTYDKNRAEQLAETWKHVAPVTVGGVAYGDTSLEFVPGKYIKNGYTFTSRGCPRTCWFCGVWKKWPTPHLLPIQNGWNVLDDNLLACPESHVRAVFDMLARQGRRVEFTGGLEALALQDYQVELLSRLRPKPTCFFAYDPGDAFETLQSAASRMLAAGFTRQSHRLRCYVLIGYPKDTFEAAEHRLRQITQIGFTPMAMLWRPETCKAMKWAAGPEWRVFQRRWARPAIIHAHAKYHNI